MRGGRAPYVLSGVLALAATAAAGLSVSYPDVLGGNPAGNGNLHGTALAVLSFGLPALIAAMSLTAKGSTRAFVVWLGTLGYLLYQAVLLCFATPLNNLFLVYLLFLGLSLWSIATLLRATDLRAFATRVAPTLPIRWVAGFTLGLVAVNSAAWLGRIVPAVLGPTPRSLLDGTDLLTNPVYVQDLAVWLPLAATAAVVALRRGPWGTLVTGSMLAMYVLECLSIAVDQWFGAHADPTSPIASAAMTPVFAVAAALIAVPLALYLRHVDRRPTAVPNGALRRRDRDLRRAAVAKVRAEARRFTARRGP
ncbi:hypothetical protein [Actinokineospora terrae]|uniref:hypothetical protein n=1 Tax=Actinokineospora terrae TaxID=155974 RepID=UPI00116039A5|nr:hypothetical protein [Actinokineospora terrae]